MKASAPPTAAASLSISATSCRARAKLMAQARPMSPAPTTATFAMAYGAPLQALDIAVDADGLAGDVGAGPGQQEHDRLGDVLVGHHPAQRDALQIALLHLLMADAELLGPGGDHPVHALALDDARQDGIDADVVGPELLGQALGEADDAPLRRGIGGAEGIAEA